MGTFSIWHWVIVLVVVLVLFGGGGKISRLMGDFGKGMKAFKKSIKDDEGAESAEAPETTIEPDKITSEDGSSARTRKKTADKV